MRISRVHTDSLLRSDSMLQLPAELSHYLSHVLRLKVASTVHLFNSRDGEYAGEIARVEKQEVLVALHNQIRKPEEPVLKINLGLGLSRGARMDFAIQKSTELGVTQLTPITTAHGEVKLKPTRIESRLRHWRKIAISACEQSGKINIPEIFGPASITDWYQNTAPGLNLLFEPGGQEKFPGNAGESATVNLLIGPEGGFSEQEIDWGRNNKFSIVGLGPHILRTETAPIAVLSILQYLYGDMN